MADGAIVISTKIDQSGVVSGKKQLENTLDGLKNSIKSVASALGLAFGGAAALAGIKSSVKATNELSNALTGLKSILDGQGRSFKDAQKFIDEYISDGLIPATNAITSYKNLAAAKYDDGQIQTTLTNLKNSAAFGRQAHLSMGEAVQSASEGLKNQNSILVDNAGVTKNVAIMWKEYADRLGVGVNSLTQQQRIQAEVNGIMEETRFQTGDAAKMAGEFSGSLSRTTFNLNNLKIAIGNAFKPIIQYALPAVNSLISALTKAANLFAQFTTALFGRAKTQTTITNDIASAVDNQEALTKATKETAKAAKDALMPFDELNVISQDTASSADAVSAPVGGAAEARLPSASGEIGGDIKISPKVQEFVDRIRGALGAIGPMLKGVVAAAGVLFGAKIIGQIVKWGKALAVAFKAMSPAQKLSLAIAGMAAVFMTTADAVKGLVTGSKSLESALLAVIPVVAAVGTALYLMYGPLGLVLTAIGVMAGALYGVNEAQKQLREEFIKAEFFDGVGISLDAFNEYLLSTDANASVARDAILKMKSALEENNGKITEAKGALETSQLVIESTGKVTEEQAGKMKQSFSDLVAGMKESLEINANIIFEAFKGSSAEAAKALGIDVGQMVTVLEGFKRRFSDETTRLSNDMNKFLTDNAGKALTPEQKAEFDRIMSYATDLSRTVTESQIKMKGHMSDISKIDFGNADDAARKISEIADTGKKMQEDLEQSRLANETAIANFRQKAETMFKHGTLSQEVYNQYMEAFGKAEAGLKAGYERDKATIDGEISKVMGAIQSSFEKQALKAGAGAKLTWLEKLLYGDVIGPIELKKKVNEELSPLQNAITNALKDLKIAPDKVQGEQLIKSMSGLGTGAAKGFETGIKGKTDDVVNGGKNLFEGLEGGVKTAGDFGSPSKIMEKYGRWASEGFENGVKSKQGAVVSSFTTLFNAILSKTDLFCQRFQESINGLMSGMTGSMNGISLSKEGAIRYTQMPKIKIPRLATGAKIPPRAEFLSVLGDQKHGYNLEGPESMFRRIVREESGGGYSEELMERMVGLLEAIAGKDFSAVVQVNDREIARASNSGNRALGYPVKA